MTTKLHRTAFQREILHRHHGLNDALFVGFLLTIVQSVVPRNDVYVDLFLFSDMQITIASVVWIVGMNIYVAILFMSHYKLTGMLEYKVISALYVFSIIELFMFYDQAWFYVLGVPMYSETMIAMTFAYIFAKDKFSL